MSINATIASYPVSNEVFLRAIFGNRWGEALVAYFPGDPRPSRNRGANFTTYPASTVLAAMSPKFNNYYDIALPMPGGTSHKLADFGALCAIVVDDIGTKVPLGVAQQVLGMASYLLETSPANYQAGWICDPITDRAWANGMLRVLHAALGADNLKKITTLVRLPVGVNGKVELGPAGFPCELVQWHPQRRIVGADWIGIEQRIGRITPLMPRVSLSTAMPDPAEIEADPILKVFRDRGMVLGLGREMTFGWGFEVTCPWAGDHSDPRTEAGYVPVKGRFKCHHGHCQDRTMDDVRAWADAVIREDSGGLETLAAQDFDVIAPDQVKTVAFTRVSTGEAIDLWAEKIPAKWPGGVLPNRVEDALFRLNECDGVDLGALGTAMVTAGSGASDKRTILRPYASSWWQVRPVLWHMQIAKIGIRKSEILRHPLALMRERHAAAVRQYKIAIAAWKALPTAQRNQLPVPTVAALLADDVTIERLQEMMAGNPRGLLYLRDELASLFDFGRYSANAGAAERAFFLEAYEGGPRTVERMSRTTQIDNCALAILGGIQPDRLADFKNLSDDGLLSRFGMNLPQKTISGTGQGPLPDLAPINALIEQLLRNGAFDEYRTDDKGETLIRDTEAFGNALYEEPDIGTGFGGFLLKLHGMHARAALVLHLMDGGQDQVIPFDTVKRAERYILFLYQHAEVFYAGLPGSSDAVARAIGSYILRKPLDRVTAGQLRRDIAACKPMTSDREIHNAVWPLVIGGWLKPETNFPSNKAWVIRPDIRNQFAARIASETVRADGVSIVMNRKGLHRVGKSR